MILKLNYDELISKIKEKGLEEKDIETKITEKLEQLNGLISKEGAAHLIANELGVKLFEDVGEVKINKLLAGMRDVEVNGKVISLYEVRSFNRNGREGRVASFLIGDETGRVRIAIWDEPLIEKFNILKEDNIVKLKNCYVRENNGFKELHLGKGGNFDVNPEGVVINEIAQNSFQGSFANKTILELNENDKVALRGTMVQIFEPRFYEVCKQCGKRARMNEGNFKCQEHGVVEVIYNAVINFYLDDGSDNIRCVAFRDEAKALLEIDDLEPLRVDATKFDDIKDNLLGKQLEINGRVVKNDMFDRKEFIASSLEPLKAEKLLAEVNNDN
tara:strand:- start:104 stop:1093 length:990 start_codon:yes stop_codon:yes gene_type:complete